MNGCSKKNREIIQENNLKQNKKKPGLTFNPGLAIISFSTTRLALTVKLHIFFSSEIGPKLFHVPAIFFFPEKELEFSTPLMERLLFINHVNNRSFNQCSILDKMFHRWTINSMGKKRVKSCKGNINQCLRFSFRLAFWDMQQQYKESPNHTFFIAFHLTERAGQTTALENKIGFFQEVLRKTFSFMYTV